jgi:DNA-binding HxlR family transcriptional regulator
VRRASFEEMSCSIAQALEQIGEWWTLLIIRDALMGVRRFEDFQSDLGIARNVLATRLDALVDNGIMERRPYSDRPPRHEYVLTDKGKDLWSVATVIRQWGDKWLVPEDSWYVQLQHLTCGKLVEAELHCSECGERLERRDLRVVPGPGADTLPGRAGKARDEPPEAHS